MGFCAKHKVLKQKIKDDTISCMKGGAKKKGGIAVLVVFLAACAVLYVYIYVIPSVSGAFMQTSTARYAQMYTKNSARCIVIRDETTVRADAGGKSSYYIREGEKARKGVKVADVYSAGGVSEGYKLANTSVVSYFCDGLETLYSPGTVETLGPEAFEFPSDHALWAPVDVKKDSVSAGDTLFKTVNSDTWYMALLIDKEQLNEYSMGKEIAVCFGEDRIESSVCRMAGFEGGWVIIAQTKRYYSEFQKLRYCEVEVITQDNKGLAIPTSAIALKEQEDGSVHKGVYVKNINGEFNFYRVYVLAEDRESEQTLVAADRFYEKDENGDSVRVDTIGIYDEVLRDAGALSDVIVSDDAPREEEEIVFEWEKRSEETGE